jgi:hypothetical protein
VGGERGRHSATQLATELQSLWDELRRAARSCGGLVLLSLAGQARARAGRPPSPGLGSGFSVSFFGVRVPF